MRAGWHWVGLAALVTGLTGCPREPVADPPAVDAGVEDRGERPGDAPGEEPGDHPDEPGDAPDGPADCEAACAAELDDCDGDPWCFEALARCLTGCEGTPDEPEPEAPGACRDWCAAEGAGFRDGCMAAGGDPDGCTEQAQALIRTCVGECDGAPEGDCLQGCDADFEGLVTQCTHPDGEVDQDCLAWANELRIECVLGCEPPPPESCEAQCDPAEIWPDCEAEGLPEAQCDEVRANWVEHCLASCEPASGNCNSDCAADFEANHRECIAADGQVDEACLQATEAAFDACQAACEPEPTPAEDCPLLCDGAFEAAHAMCVLADGQVDEACLRAAEARLGECLQACNPEPPMDCVAQCEADEVWAECEASGVPEDECAQWRDAWFQHCVEGCNPEPAPDCAGQCQADFALELEGCTRPDGQVDEACLQAAEAAFEDCGQACEPEPAADCRPQCVAEFDGLSDACVNEEGADEVCLQDAQDWLAECLRACP